jgi:glycosyltransferase involved in cell wall biosynthesis
LYASYYLELSIIIPAFNEALNIANCIERTVASNPNAEIIIVDGGSDNTVEIVNKYLNRYPNLKYISNRPDLGKGHAIRVGIKNASGNFIAQLDSDLQFYPEELNKLIDPLKNNQADFILGSRFMANSTRNQGSTPVFRSFGNFFISAYASFLFQIKMTDVLAGIKAWKKEVTDSFILESNTYSYEVELPIKAYLKGFRLLDMPVTTEARKNGVSSVRVIRVGLNVLFDITKWRIKSLLGWI